MLLTNEERSKFAKWLEFQAYSSRELLKAMEHLSMPGIKDRERAKLAAYIFLHKELTDVEIMTIRSDQADQEVE